MRLRAVDYFACFKKRGMEVKHLAAVIAIFAVSGFTSSAWAFSCPAHFKIAQASVDTAVSAMEGVADKTKKGLVHTLIDEAKTILQSARHNHEKPAAGAYDHARALAKADTAKAYAEAATALVKS